MNLYFFLISFVNKDEKIDFNIIHSRQDSVESVHFKFYHFILSLNDKGSVRFPSAQNLNRKKFYLTSAIFAKIILIA